MSDTIQNRLRNGMATADRTNAADYIDDLEMILGVLSVTTPPSAEVIADYRAAAADEIAGDGDDTSNEQAKDAVKNAVAGSTGHAAATSSDTKKAAATSTDTKKAVDSPLKK